MVDIQMNEVDRLVKVCIADIEQIKNNQKENEYLASVIMEQRNQGRVHFPLTKKKEWKKQQRKNR